MTLGFKHNWYDNTAVGYLFIRWIIQLQIKYTVGIGQHLENANTTGEDNTAVGKDALTANTTEQLNNTALRHVGYAALECKHNWKSNTCCRTKFFKTNTTGVT